MISLRKLRQKKGDAVSLLIGIVMIIVFAVCAIFFSFFIKNIYSGLQEDNVGSDYNQNINDTLNTMDGLRIYSFDYMTSFYIFGVMIALIIGSIFLDYHPVWIILFLFITLFAVYLAMQEVNMYDDLRNDDTIGSTVTEHSVSNLLLNRYFPLVVFITGCISMIILYGKRNAGGSYGAV